MCALYPVHRLTDTQTHTHTQRQIDYWGHPFRVSGFFPSTYHQGSVQQTNSTTGWHIWGVWIRTNVLKPRSLFYDNHYLGARNLLRNRKKYLGQNMPQLTTDANWACHRLEILVEIWVSCEVCEHRSTRYTMMECRHESRMLFTTQRLFPSHQWGKQGCVTALTQFKMLFQQYWYMILLGMMLA